MPKLSAFTKLGHLRLTSKPSHGELLYRAKINALGEQFDTSEGSRMDALCYAQAMGEARVRYKLDRAGAQLVPSGLVDCIAKREAEFGLVPAPNATVQERRAAIAARTLLPLGANTNNVKNALIALLGSDFVAYRTTAVGEIVNTPTNAGDQPMNLVRHDTLRKVVRVTQAVALTGTPFVVQYTPLDAESVLTTGDVVVIDPDNAAQAERFTVTTCTFPGDALGSTVYSFAITALRSHDAGCLATTQPFPEWQSTQRAVIVALTSTAAIDNEKRRKTDEQLARMLGETSTWCLVQQTTTGHTGPFVIGTSPLGATTLGDVTL